MKIEFAPQLPRAGALVVLVTDDSTLSPTALRLEKATRGALKRAIGASRFTGARDQSLTIHAPQGQSLSRIVLAGIGKPELFDALAAESLGSRITAELALSGEKAVAVAADAMPKMKAKPAELAAHLALGAMLRSYRFDKYRTKQKPTDKPSLQGLTVVTPEAQAARALFGPQSKVGEAVFMTRDLVSEPANVIYPETLAREAQTLKRFGVRIDVLDVAQMKRLGMGALLGVGLGSARPPRLVAMRWEGAPRARDRRPIAFIGKGVTFDTGGISIKPAASMEDMKWDMGGAGVVIGLMRALAARKAKVNAVGIVGLVENMPSANAQRPGDVVHTMSGQTIEVINTDAEGRLVLSDAMWYCQDRFKPHTMIDLATLTGAIIVALGHEHAGLFANDDELVGRLIAAGKSVGEKLWHMPLGEAYDKDINSDIADMKNVGAGRAGGSITAAQLLKRFVQDGVKWAHLDIAGVTWTTKDRPTTPKGATAFGLRLLDRLVAANYEER